MISPVGASMKIIDVPGRRCPSLVMSSLLQSSPRYWRRLSAAASEAGPPRMAALVSGRRLDDDVHSPALEPCPLQGFHGRERSLLLEFNEGKTTRPAAAAADDSEGGDPSESRERGVQVALVSFGGQVSDEESSQFTPPFGRTSPRGAMPFRPLVVNSRPGSVD